MTLPEKVGDLTIKKVHMGPSGLFPISFRRKGSKINTRYYCNIAYSINKCNIAEQYIYFCLLQKIQLPAAETDCLHSCIFSIHFIQIRGAADMDPIPGTLTPGK